MIASWLLLIKSMRDEVFDFFRLTIASVDKDGKVTERKSSEIQKISLQKDEVTPIQHISVSMLHHL